MHRLTCHREQHNVECQIRQKVSWYYCADCLWYSVFHCDVLKRADLVGRESEEVVIYLSSTACVLSSSLSLSPPCYNIYTNNNNNTRAPSYYYCSAESTRRARVPAKLHRRLLSLIIIVGLVWRQLASLSRWYTRNNWRAQHHTSRTYTHMCVCVCTCCCCCCYCCLAWKLNSHQWESKVVRLRHGLFGSSPTTLLLWKEPSSICIPLFVVWSASTMTEEEERITHTTSYLTPLWRFGESKAIPVLSSSP